MKTSSIITTNVRSLFSIAVICNKTFISIAYTHPYFSLNIKGDVTRSCSKQSILYMVYRFSVQFRDGLEAWKSPVRRGVRLEELQGRGKPWESGETRLEKALKMLPAIDPEKLKPSPDSLRQLKDEILNDAKGEEWLRAKVLSLEYEDGFNFKELLNEWGLLMSNVLCDVKRYQVLPLLGWRPLKNATIVIDVRCHELYYIFSSLTPDLL